MCLSNSWIFLAYFSKAWIFVEYYFKSGFELNYYFGAWSYREYMEFCIAWSLSFVLQGMEFYIIFRFLKNIFVQGIEFWRIIFLRCGVLEVIIFFITRIFQNVFKRKYFIFKAVFMDYILMAIFTTYFLQAWICTAYFLDFVYFFVVSRRGFLQNYFFYS